jgi:uncharacterized membrane protein
MLRRKIWRRSRVAIQLIGALLVAWDLLALATCIGQNIHSNQTYNDPAYHNQAVCLGCVITSGPFPTVLRYFGEHPDVFFIAMSAIATIFIAWFTLTLRRSTDKLWKANVDQFRLAKETADRQAVEIQDQLTIARDAAEATKKSADAAVATERARLYAVIAHNFEGIVRSAMTWENTPTVDEKVMAATESPMATIKFKNYGKTPALIGEVELGLIYSETVPDGLVYDSRVVKENIVAADQTTEDFPLQMTGQMTLGMAKRMQKGWGNLWVYGRVFYDDVFGERRIHGFLQRYVRISDYRFVLQSYDHEHYNVST